MPHPPGPFMRPGDVVYNGKGADYEFVAYNFWCKVIYVLPRPFRSSPRVVVGDLLFVKRNSYLTDVLGNVIYFVKIFNIKTPRLFDRGVACSGRAVYSKKCCRPLTMDSARINEASMFLQIWSSPNFWMKPYLSSVFNTCFCTWDNTSCTPSFWQRS